MSSNSGPYITTPPATPHAEAAIANPPDPDRPQAVPTPSPGTQSSVGEASRQRSLQLALAAAEVAHENRGEAIVVLDLQQVTPFFDYFVIATGSSRRQLHAISEEIDHRLEDDLGDERMGIEGYRDSRWILLDYGSVVIHLLDEETREYYALEELWSGSTRVPLPWDDEQADEVASQDQGHAAEDAAAEDDQAS
ncbi:MAG: ribosome silencing factor [Planctomycetota bacterium]